MFCFVLFVVFFFQAEDGIRDIGVTGVQTCALPILKNGIVYVLVRLVENTTENEIIDVVSYGN